MTDKELRAELYKVLTKFIEEHGGGRETLYLGEQLEIDLREDDGLTISLENTVPISWESDVQSLIIRSNGEVECQLRN